MERVDKENRISVVVPMYNCEEFIVGTLDSVFHQTVKPCELILVDDGSEDDTVSIVRKYLYMHSKQIDNVRLIEQKNGGAGKARNRGIKEATGNWVSFLDSDDLWDNHKIERIIDTIGNNLEASIIAHSYRICNNYTGEITISRALRHFDKRKELFPQLYNGNFLATSCLTVKHDIIQQLGGFDITLRSGQDFDLWLRIAAIGGKLVAVNEDLASYQVRAGNLSSNYVQRYDCTKRILTKYKCFLNDYMSKRRINRFARNALAKTIMREDRAAAKKKDKDSIVFYSWKLLMCVAGREI